MGRVRPSMEPNGDFVIVDGHGGRHVDRVAEDLPYLGVSVAPHPSCHEAIEAAGDDEEGHVKVDLEPDGGAEGVHVKEPYGVRERVLDEHALGVAGDDLLGGS